MTLKIPKLIYGEDNGYCSLWDITLSEYDLYRDRLAKLEYGSDEDKDKYDELEKELDSHRIVIDSEEYGYVPDYVTYLAKIFKFDVDSN